MMAMAKRQEPRLGLWTHATDLVDGVTHSFRILTVMRRGKIAYELTLYDRGRIFLVKTHVSQWDAVKQGNGWLGR